MIRFLITLLQLPLIILGYIGYREPKCERIFDLMGIA